MEIIVTLAYFFLVRLIFFDYRVIKFNLFWKFIVFGIYIAAALTEIIMLGQYTPYSKELIVESRVLQIAPEFGGIVKKVQAEPNTPMKRGDPLFEMDPEPWQYKVNSLKAQLAEAQEKYHVERVLVEKGAGVREKMINLKDEVDTLKANLDEAQYNLDHAVIVAPSDGYVVDLQLRAGVFIRLKQPVMTFIDSEAYALIAAIPQKASQWVREGNEVEVALDMYPGKVFPAEVENVIWATGRAQLPTSGVLPTAGQVAPSELFVAKIRYKGDETTHPLRFGASGLAAIYTGEGPAVFKLLRQLEIRSESWLNYLYNPF